MLRSRCSRVRPALRALLLFLATLVALPAGGSSSVPPGDPAEVADQERLRARVDAAVAVVSPDATAAEVRQEVLPSLEARRAAAEARSADAARYFAGALVLEAAFPRLAGTPLLRPHFLMGELRRLDRLEAARARQRVARLPQLDDARLAARLADARTATLDAEDAADAYLRRLLLAIHAGLDAAPGLAEGRTEPQVERWRALQPVTRDLGEPDPSDPQEASPPDDLPAAAAAADAQAALAAFQRAALRAMTVPGDTTLTELVEADLAAPPELTPPLTEAEEVRADAWEARLRMVRPLLSPDLQQQVSDAVAAEEIGRLRTALPDLEARLAQARAALETPPADALPVAQAADQVARREAAAARAQDRWTRLQQAHPAIAAAVVGAATNGTSAQPAPAQDAPDDAAGNGTSPANGSSLPDGNGTSPANGSSPPDGNGTSPTATPVDLDSADAVRLRHAWLTWQIAQAERTRAQQVLDAARIAEDAAATSQAEVDEARRKADEAAARAEQSATAQEAEVRGVLAALQSEVADRLGQERRRHLTRAEELKGLLADWETARDKADEALALPTLSVGREGRLDAAFLELRAVVRKARTAVDESRDNLVNLRSEASHLQRRLPDLSELPPETREQLAPEVAEVEADLGTVIGQAEAHAVKELDWALQILEVAKDDRRRLRPHASARARDEVLASFMDELWLESVEAPVIVMGELRTTWAEVSALPRKVTDLTAVTAFLTRSIELVVLVVLWFGLRRNGEDWARRLLDLLRQQDMPRVESTRKLAAAGWFVDGDLRALAPQLATALRFAVDVAVAWGLYALSRNGLAPLALLFLLWLGRSLYQLGPAVVDLLVTTPAADRPGLRMVASATAVRLQQSVKAVIAAVVALRIMRFVALDLFQADRMADLVALTALPIYGVLVLWLLHTWADSIRGAILATGEQDAIATRLVKEGDSAVLRWLRAAGGLAWLIWRGGAELTVRVAEGRPGLGWLASALARARLNPKVEEDAQPTPSGILRKLDETPARVPRPEQEQALREAMAAWGEERRRGIVGVVGHEGAGKSELLTVAEELAPDVLPDVPVVRLSLPGRVHQPGPALHWLAQATGCKTHSVRHRPTEDDIDRLVTELSEMPPRVFLVDDLHRLVLRAVGGFDGIRVVLRVMQATGEEHLWICSFHGPTWDYLAGVSSQVNTDAFRARIVLPPLSGTQLAEWVRGRVDAAGYALRFDPLVGGGALASNDQGRARERAEQAYWRLLSDASLGIPTVAWEYLQAGLCTAPVPKALDVRMFVAPEPAELESLPDLDLFVLTALVLHDDLDGRAISAVLNSSPGHVQESCRHLDALGIIDQLDGGDWTIIERWRPAIHRVLRQKHFLYLR